MVAGTTGIHSACLVTGDGFEIASVLRDGVSGERLAAMTSSVHALGAAVVSELQLTDCASVIIDGESGSVVVVRLPANGTEMMLAAICDNKATLGDVFFAAREQAKSISEKFGAAA
jgi:predicted regulator of Ras-like GTPase activity (Roadblock/LC7/MglB family)